MHDQLSRRYRFTRYLMGVGIFVMPLLAYIDFRYGYYISSVAKTIASFICLAGFLLASHFEYANYINKVVTVALLVVALIGAITKLDSILEMIWVPVLPILFFYLSSIRVGLIFCSIYLFVYCASYLLYPMSVEVVRVDIDIWLQSVFAFSIAGLLSYWYERENIRQETQLRQVAELDYLTGALNRRGVLRYMQDEVKRSERYHGKLSIILFDIDNFKRINDYHGHGLGDNLLVELTQFVKQQIRTSDVLARWGGEEFLIVTPHTDLHACMELAEKLRCSIATRTFTEIDKVTVSSGVVEQSPGEVIRELVNRADKALYEAKRKGKNCVVHHADVNGFLSNNSFVSSI